MLKVGKLLKCFIPLLVFLAVSLIAGMVFLIPYSFNAYAMGITDPEQLQLYLLSSDVTLKVSFISEILLLIVAFIGYKFVMKMKFDNPVKVFSTKFVVFSVLFFIGCTFLTNILLAVVSNLAPDVIARYSKMMEMSGLESLNWMSTVLAVVLAPIVEELTFRGMTLRLANKFTDKFYIANFIQALTFGIAHLNIVQGVYAFALGLLLGYVYKKYNSLYASILGHMLFNFAGTFGVKLVFGLGDEISTGRMIVVLVVSVVAVAGALFVLKSDTVAQLRSKMYASETAAIYSASYAVKEKVKYVLTDDGYVPLNADGTLATEANAAEESAPKPEDKPE